MKESFLQGFHLFLKNQLKALKNKEIATSRNKPKLVKLKKHLKEKTLKATLKKLKL
jgi:hypothetical protein